MLNFQLPLYFTLGALLYCLFHLAPEDILRIEASGRVGQCPPYMLRPFGEIKQSFEIRAAGGQCLWYGRSSARTDSRNDADESAINGAAGT